MANLKDLRTRITSVSSTMQITSAMKMVSAAKLKRAQDAIVQMRPYSQKLTLMMGNVSSVVDSSENLFFKKRKENRVLILSLTANRGLCGAFNSSVIKKSIALSQKLEKQGLEVKFFAIGKKSRDLLSKTGKVEGENIDVVNGVTFEGAEAIAQIAMENYLSGKYDKVIMVYNQFRNAAVQILQEEQLFPFVEAPKENNEVADYIYEPDQQKLLDELIPLSIKTQVYKALLDSQASEHGARMTSMHKATDNATNMRDDLKLKYNKARQATITNEILEIVGGAEALNS
jgi:F-type H+-transporting ATPase subunit gamma